VSKFRILVADDHEMVRVTLRQLISRADKAWDVCCEAVDGVDAVSKAVEHRPDLIILDFSMPRMDGISASRKIRASLPQVPILIHSIFASRDLDREAYEAGAQAVVQKGNARALIAETGKHISQKPVAARRAARATAPKPRRQRKSAFKKRR
jgi:DNA-binding NarL/FixJ family response regulator